MKTYRNFSEVPSLNAQKKSRKGKEFDFWDYYSRFFYSGGQEKGKIVAYFELIIGWFPMNLRQNLDEIKIL